MSEVPTAWILGAGFSRSLGGPLLNDLLSMRNRALHCARDPDHANNALFNQAYALYHYGRCFPERYLFDPLLPELKGARLWEDAEQFLEIVSQATSEDAVTSTAPFLQEQWATLRSSFNSSYARLYKRHAGLTERDLNFEQLAPAVANLVALECDFVRRNRPADLDQWERARPYVAWGRRLNKNDTIITFNYDTVVEEVACDRAQVLGVKNPEVGRQDDDAPLLLKLHGSIDWRREGNEYERIEGPLPDPPAIATPGNAKLAMREGGFRQLWDKAAKLLEEADQVGWLGYSMPQSDASAVQLMLESLSRNPNGALAVDLALGKPSTDVDRIAELLEGVLEPRPIRDIHDLRQVRAAIDRLESNAAEYRSACLVAANRKQGLTESEERRYRTLFEEVLELEGFVNGAVIRGRERPEFQVRKLPLYAQDYLRSYSTRHQQASDKIDLEEDLSAAAQQLRDKISQLRR